MLAQYVEACNHRPRSAVTEDDKAKVEGLAAAGVAAWPLSALVEILKRTWTDPDPEV